MKKTWDFARAFLLAPSTAADSCARPDALKQGLTLYAVLAVLQLVSSWFDPLAFLDPNAPIVAPHGAGFWAAVALWEPVLMAMSVFFTVLTLEWMREGWLPLKTAGATLWSALPVALSLYYTARDTALSRPLAIVLLALWAAPAVLLARRVPAERWRPVAVFVLGMSAVQIACLLLELVVVVPLRTMAGFYAVSFLTLGWVLVCFAAGMRRLTGASAARASLAFLFALVVSSVLPALAFLLGLMPKEVLKVVLYV